MNEDPISVAQRLLATGRQADAIALIAQAAVVGNAAALFQQGFWYLAGTLLPRDLGRARAALQKAAARGHGEAQLVDAALVANGSGAKADWRQARRKLENYASTNSHAKHLLSLLKAMHLDGDGRPLASPAAVDLTTGGAVRRVSGFLTNKECAHVANSVADILAHATVADPITGKSIPHPIRTSDAAVIGPVREDPVIRAINQRIAGISNTVIEQGEALTVLRYGPGQQFRMHSDALPAVGNQRVKTVLVYLNDAFTGGETVFPDHGLTIRPVAGDAVIFTNTLPGGKPDPRARHAGLPIIGGTKWLATRWIRERPFDVWSGPESAP